MGIISTIKGWFGMLATGKVKEEFQVSPITSPSVEKVVNSCVNAYKGTPEWISSSESIKTINFAKALCSETARLTTLAIGIKVGDGARGEWLQEQIDKIYHMLREWTEYSCAYGTVILKPELESVEMYLPGDFAITNTRNGEITGIVFISREADEFNKKYYTRFEYHRFNDDGSYTITNRCKVGGSRNDAQKDIAIEKTPWVGLVEEATISNIENPLYAVLRTPLANNVDVASPFALPIIADVIEELRDLDVAYSRNAKEIEDSKRTVLIDSDRLLPTGGKIANTYSGFENRKKNMQLPDMVKIVYGSGAGELYHEINPALNTEMRIKGINALLSQIGYKIGFSNGHFVFNESTGIQTATGVEAEQQRTIQFIKDMRDKLEHCLDRLIYALNAFADLYALAPLGTYEVTYDFGDITYNREEDRARCYSWVQAGRFPFWKYLVKFEGYTEEEAKEIEAEARPKQPTLFGNEE